MLLSVLVQDLVEEVWKNQNLKKAVLKENPIFEEILFQVLVKSQVLVL